MPDDAHHDWPDLRPEDVLRPTAVRPVGENRYAIDLGDATGHKRTVVLTVTWIAPEGWGVTHIDGYSMAEEALFDTRPMVGLAIAMHRAIYYQFAGPMSPARNPRLGIRSHPVTLPHGE